MKMPFALLVTLGLFSTSVLAQEVGDTPKTEPAQAPAAEAQVDDTPAVEVQATEAAEQADSAPAVQASELSAPAAVAEQAESAPAKKAPCIKAKSKRIGVTTSGFLRLGYRAVLQDDASPDFVGQNDGFYVESARVNFDLSSETITGRLSLDGAVNKYDARNTAEGEVSVSLLDAYFDYPLIDGLAVRTGQFRPAFDLEAARTRDEMVFVDRAVYSRGVRGVDGFNARGLGLSREVGMAVHGGFGAAKSAHGGYQVALTNGEDSESIVNDNDLPAASARVTVGYQSFVTLGLGGRYNRRTTGAAPDKIEQDEMSFTADLQLLRQFGANTLALEGALSQRTIEIKDVGREPSITKLGYHAAAMLSRGGVTLAYRYASFDPTSEFGENSDGQLLDAFDADTLIHHTVGLSYRPKQGPLTLQTNFTVAQEDDTRAYANDRVDLLAQLVF